MKLWLTVNSLVLLLLCGAVLLILRQLGFLLQRAGSMGARGSGDGPRVGESLSTLLHASGVFDGKPKLLVFMSEHCAICRVVRKGAEVLAKDWHGDASILLIYDSDQGGAKPAELIADGLHLKKDSAMRQQLGIAAVPYAVVASADGLVVSKGLVNDVSHLESLLEVEQSLRAKPHERIGASQVAFS